MPTNVQYKGNLLTTINNNQSKTLKTAGKYMEGDVIISDATYLQGDKVVTPTTSVQYVVPDDWTFIATTGDLTDNVEASMGSDGGTLIALNEFPQNFNLENNHRYIGELVITSSLNNMTQHIYIDADLSITNSVQSIPFKSVGDELITEIRFYNMNDLHRDFHFKSNTGNKIINFYINVYDTSNSIYDGLSHVVVNAGNGGSSVTITNEQNATGITCVITTSSTPEPTPSGIPLNTELVDITKLTSDYAIDSSGNAVSAQYYCATDYIPVESGMTFDYTGCYWYYLAVYDSSKEPVNVININLDSTVDPDNGNIGHGTLSGIKLPQTSAYVRITGVMIGGSYRVSLIRTA